MIARLSRVRFLPAWALDRASYAIASRPPSSSSHNISGARSPTYALSESPDDPLPLLQSDPESEEPCSDIVKDLLARSEHCEPSEPPDDPLPLLFFDLDFEELDNDLEKELLGDVIKSMGFVFLPGPTSTVDRGS
jgi:hypothetical protein